MNETKQLQAQPGDVEVKEFYIYTNTGKQFDISGMFVEMSVFENIFSNSLSGVISMVDTHNLISELPLLGEEFVVFTYKQINATEYTTLFFRTYKVSDRIIDGNKQMYKIHLITQEMFLNASMNISKYYSGTAETIVAQLIKNELQSGKTVSYDPSGNSLKLTAPFWSPFKCISWATQKAVSSDIHRSADFLFYETVSGYNLRNINLAKTAAPVASFVHSHKPGTDDAQNKQPGELIQQIISMSTPLIVDQLDRINNSVYKTITYAHDMTFKSLNISSFNLDEDWPNINKMNPNKPFSSNLSNFISADIKVASEMSYSHDDKTYDWQGIIAGKRTASLMRLEMMKVDVEVWGQAGLEAGNTVNLTLGKYSQNDTKGNDEYYSGKYMISAIHHRFAPKQYKMYMQLIKDSTNGSFD